MKSGQLSVLHAWFHLWRLLTDSNRQENFMQSSTQLYASINLVIKPVAWQKERVHLKDAKVRCSYLLLCVQTLTPEDTIYTLRTATLHAKGHLQYICVYMCGYILANKNKQKHERKTWPKQIQSKNKNKKWRSRKEKKQQFLSWEGKDGRRWCKVSFILTSNCDLLNRSNMNVYWVSNGTVTVVSSTLLLGTVSGEDRPSN